MHEEDEEAKVYHDDEDYQDKPLTEEEEKYRRYILNIQAAMEEQKLRRLRE